MLDLVIIVKKGYRYFKNISTSGEGKGPFGLREEEGEVEESRVELDKNWLILGQFHFTQPILGQFHSTQPILGQFYSTLLYPLWPVWIERGRRESGGE